MRRTYSIIGALFAILAFGLAIPSARAATATLQGTVRDSNLVPISGATVIIGSLLGQPLISPTHTNSLGQYSITAPEGPNSILVTPLGSASTPGTTMWVYVLLAAPTTTLDVAMPTGFPVSGHVSENGSAVENATVEVFLTPPQATASHFSTKTNAVGDYQLVVPAGSYHSVVSFTKSLGVTTPVSDVRFRYTSDIGVTGPATIAPVDFVTVNHTVNILSGSLPASGND